MGSRVPLPEPTWKQADNIEDTVATNMDHATGLERSEMLAHMEGRNIFDEHPIGHFGTKENPYIVESIFDERIGEKDIAILPQCSDREAQANARCHCGRLIFSFDSHSFCLLHKGT